MAGLPATAADRRIGERIQYARQAAHLTQRAVATAIGISAAQVQKYEKGTNCISASSLQIVADLVGRPIGWFFDPRIDDPALGVAEAQDLTCFRNIVALVEAHRGPGGADREPACAATGASVTTGAH